MTCLEFVQFTSLEEETKIILFGFSSRTYFTRLQGREPGLCLVHIVSLSEKGSGNFVLFSGLFSSGAQEDLLYKSLIVQYVCTDLFLSTTWDICLHHVKLC